MSLPEDPDGPDPSEEPVEFEFTDELDLHPFHPRDVADLVRAYLEHASAQGWTHVRIIHGKGIGAIRATVHRVLAAHPAVASFAAPTDRGSWGATSVVLRAGERGSSADD